MHKIYICYIDIGYKVVKGVVFMFKIFVIHVIRYLLNLLRHNLRALKNGS
ncbi:hypothetical protein Hanom_Chr06g00553231 [Helianthus anomalus]